MFRFFSKIRKSQINEGKTGQYLKYAIGEIFLVVIGILIALQINNWNEQRQLQNEINTYSAQKLENLKEDLARLLEIKDLRIQKSENSRKLLDIGVANVDASLASSLYPIFIERHFITTIERNESSTVKYYSGTKESAINKLEKLYINKIVEMKLEESRLNTFSENAELSLWTNGFFIDNREVFASMPTVAEPKKFNGKDTKLISNHENGKKALEGILRRNEIANPSLVAKLDKLIEINKQLIDEITSYLNNQ